MQQVALCPMEYADLADGKSCCMTWRVDAVSGGFGAIQGDIRIIDKWMENSHGIATAAHASYNRIGQATRNFKHLLTRLPANYGLEFAYHRGVWMRSNH